MQGSVARSYERSLRHTHSLIAVQRDELRATRRWEQHDPTIAFSNLIDTLVKVALDRPTLIVFDESQQIAAIDNGTAALRTALQHHYKDVGLLFAGSQPSAMRDIFADPTQPCLFQADIVEIRLLALDEQLATDRQRMLRLASSARPCSGRKRSSCACRPVAPSMPTTGCLPRCT